MYFLEAVAKIFIYFVPIYLNVCTMYNHGLYNIRLLLVLLVHLFIVYVFNSIFLFEQTLLLCFRFNVFLFFVIRPKFHEYGWLSVRLFVLYLFKSVSYKRRKRFIEPLGFKYYSTLLGWYSNVNVFCQGYFLEQFFFFFSCKHL